MSAHLASICGSQEHALSWALTLSWRGGQNCDMEHKKPRTGVGWAVWNGEDSRYTDIREGHSARDWRTYQTWPPAQEHLDWGLQESG